MLLDELLEELLKLLEDLELLEREIREEFLEREEVIVEELIVEEIPEELVIVEEVEVEELVSVEEVEAVARGARTAKKTSRKRTSTVAGVRRKRHPSPPQIQSAGRRKAKKKERQGVRSRWRVIRQLGNYLWVLHLLTPSWAWRRSLPTGR